MEKVLECARQLGMAIVESDVYKNMQVTEASAMNNEEVSAAMARFIELKQLIGDEMSKEDANPQLLSEYGREMDELQQKLNDMQVVDEMTAARQRFSEMKTQVNKILEFIITGENSTEGGCSGNCSGCSGCH